MSLPNRNTLWATVFVDELARAGLQTVCIAPGSRSTPLTLAFTQHEAITTYTHLDERSGAYFALGIAKATHIPTALVCTSGTATANFFPAIIEANQSQVPLLVLTTDRPPELRHSGSNQTIDQVKMYGDHVLWAVDVALPESAPPSIAIRNLRTLAGRAIAVTTGERKGVVHLNFPFRKPLEPTLVPTDNTTLATDALPRESGAAYTQHTSGTHQPSEEQITQLSNLIAQHEHGIIVCGGGCPGGDFPTAVIELAERSGYLVFAEPLSNIRFHSVTNNGVLGGYDNYLGIPMLTDYEKKIDLIIRFGAVPTSKAINQLIDQIATKNFVHVTANGQWADDTHRLSHFMHANEVSMCQQVSERIKPRHGSSWLAFWQQVEELTWNTMADSLSESFFDGAIVAELFNKLPDDSQVTIGNSLPIRQVEQFAAPATKSLNLFGNRGASGIDGIVSTALGISVTSDQPTILLIGDISFYHDLNGLLAVGQCGAKVIIVVLNNNGGGIFHRLPIHQFDPPFTEQFITPHDLQFEHAAKLYGLDYTHVTTQEEFAIAFQNHLANDNASIIEVTTDAIADEQARQRIMQNIQTKIQYHLHTKE